MHHPDSELMKHADVTQFLLHRYLVAGQRYSVTGQVKATFSFLFGRQDIVRLHSPS